MKDQQGHGSNSRGGSYPNIDKNLKRNGVHTGYANGPWSITKLGSGYLATHQRTGDSFRGDSLGHVSAQLDERNTPAANGIHAETINSLPTKTEVRKG